MNDIAGEPAHSLKVDPHETLWVTDAELIRRAGVPYKIAHAAIQVLDQTRGSGFPPKQKLWGNRRYWPAVKAYFEKAGGVIR